MKWPRKERRRLELAGALEVFSKTRRPLEGLPTAAERDVLSYQIIASIRREEYFQLIQRKGEIDPRRADPNDSMFEAELGVVYLLQTKQIDEAAWLIFLMVFFAKPELEGWTRLRDVYGSLGNGQWNWRTVTEDPNSFTVWLAANWQNIRGKFGNHRKYESLNPNAIRPIGPAIRSYIDWITGNGGHRQLFANIVKSAGNDPHVIFDAFYQGLPVDGFGRLGRFDWVSMLARYKIIPAAAGSAYLSGATGPTYGAKLLFLNDRKAKISTAITQTWLDELGQDLGLSMEILEDALCNWQKQPREFKHFKG